MTTPPRIAASHDGTRTSSWSKVRGDTGSGTIAARTGRASSAAAGRSRCRQGRGGRDSPRGTRSRWAKRGYEWRFGKEWVGLTHSRPRTILARSLDPDFFGDDETEFLADLLFDRLEDRRVVFQELLDVFAALAETLTAEREPRPALLDDLAIDSEIEQVAFLRNPLAIHHVELGLAERRRDLVLDDLHASAAANNHIAVFDRANAADVDANGRIELERAAARRRFGVAEHDADLFTQLVDEDEACLRLGDNARELAERLRHQPRLQAHLRFTHLALDFGARHQRGHRVDNDDVDPAGPHQDLDDLQRLFAVIGLRDEQVLEIHAQLARVLCVERMFGVYERGDAAGLLRLRNHLQRQRRLARRLRSEDLDHAAARHTADPERVIEAHGAGRDGGDLRDDVFPAEAHDRPLAELLFNLADGQLNRLRALAVVTLVVCRCCHGTPLKKLMRSV